MEKPNLSSPGIFDDMHTLDKLLQRSLEARGTGDYVKFLNFIAQFDHYSRYNTMLVFIQNPEVTFFGGESYWKKKFQRRIKEDARPLIILAPKHPVLLVYDVYDTEGHETVDQFLVRKSGAPKMFEVKGGLSHGKFEGILKKVTDWGVQIKFKPLSYFKAGYITTIAEKDITITLKEGESEDVNFPTLIHELAHLFLGHMGSHTLEHIGKGKSIVINHRKLEVYLEEIEAESISYLVCFALGLETRSAEYIGGYIRNVSDLRMISYESIIRTSDKIEFLFL